MPLSLVVFRHEKDHWWKSCVDVGGRPSPYTSSTNLQSGELSDKQETEKVGVGSRSPKYPAFLIIGIASEYADQLVYYTQYHTGLRIMSFIRSNSLRCLCSTLPQPTRRASARYIHLIRDLPTPSLERLLKFVS